MELAHQVMVPNGPYSKSQVVRALEFARGSLYLLSKRAVKDKQVAVAIDQWHALDDTLGHRKLARLRRRAAHQLEQHDGARVATAVYEVPETGYLFAPPQ